jgi:cell division protease FtsH
MDKKQLKPNMQGGKRNYRTPVFFIILALFGFVIFTSLNTGEKLEEVPISQVIERANNGEIKTIEVKGDELTITKKDEDKPSLKSRKEAGSNIKDQGLTNKDVVVTVKNPTSSGSTWASLGINLLPIVLLGVFLIWMLRSAQGQGNQIKSHLLTLLVAKNLSKT